MSVLTAFVCIEESCVDRQDTTWFRKGSNFPKTGQVIIQNYKCADLVSAVAYFGEVSALILKSYLKEVMLWGMQRKTSHLRALSRLVLRSRWSRLLHKGKWDKRQQDRKRQQSHLQEVKHCSTWAGQVQWRSPRSAKSKSSDKTMVVRHIWGQAGHEVNNLDLDQWGT